MFKYKSPLSRLLEGAGKSKETTEAPAAAPEEEVQEPIADLNALRNALAGGNSSTEESYEDTDELLPEDKMPEFDANAVEAEAGPSEEEAEMVEEAAEVLAAAIDAVDETAEPQETTEPAEDAAGEQVITLRVTPVAEAPEANEVAEAEAPAETEEPVLEVEPIPAEPVAEAPVAPAPAQDRRERVKTTFLGFERPDTHVQDLMETEPAAKPAAAQATFPVGWLVVTSGPGRGTSIAVTAGLMQIGRNDDQAIQLDYGDHGISRSNHAVIAYDPEDRKCYLGHGGKANLVRLNGGPVLSTVPLASGDMIRISETTMRFVALCDDNFDWRDA